MVVVDMDGTFLNGEGTVSERNRQLAAKLQRRGVHFAVATGRPVRVLQPIVDSLGLPSLPVCTFNGACLQHARASLPPTPLWEHALSSPLARTLVTLCSQQLGLGVSFSTRDASYFLGGSGAEQRELLARYERLEGVPQDWRVESIEQLFGSDVPLPLKIVALTNTPDAHAAEARAATCGLGVHVISAEMHIEVCAQSSPKSAAACPAAPRHPHGHTGSSRENDPRILCAQFVNASVNKATSVGVLCRILGLPLTSVVAFGDNMNDIEMLTSVGLGVAMANARDEVRQVAHETCASNNEDGVARKCEELMAEGKL